MIIEENGKSTQIKNYGHTNHTTQRYELITFYTSMLHFAYKFSQIFHQEGKQFYTEQKFLQNKINNDYEYYTF